MAASTRIAADLGEDEDWPYRIATDREPEDGLIWVCGLDNDSVMAYSDFGILHPLQRLELVDLPFGPAVAPGLQDRVADRLDVVLQRHRELTETMQA